MPLACGRLDDGAGAGTQADLLGQIRGAGRTCPATSKGRSYTAARQSSRADGQALAAHRLVDVLDDDLVDALFRGFAGLAEADLGAGQRLKLQA